MLDAVLYRVIAALLDINVWGGELAGGEELPEGGPAVFVANHSRSLGPIAATSSLPFRVYPWVVGDMLDFGKAPAYLNGDFVEPELRLKPPMSLFLSRVITQVSVRLLQTVGCIPVWQGEALIETYRLSVQALEKGRPLLIFPEDPKLEPDELCGMKPFKKGFARLGEMFFDRTQEILSFYPLAVHRGLRQLKVGVPIRFNPRHDRVRERSRISDALEAAIRRMLLDMTQQSYAGVPLPY